MNTSEAEALAQQHGDAFYLFDESRFVANYQSLLAAFRRQYSRTHIAYSYKTNYTPAICQRIDQLGGHAEVVSAMEYTLARRVGVDSARIVYNGPWKSDNSMTEALVAGSIVNLDSTRDVGLLLDAARGARSSVFRVGLRCNFPLEGYGDSRFGFDVDGEAFRDAIAAVRGQPNVTLEGLHCHFPYRELRSFDIRSRKIIEVARGLFEAPPRFLSIGGGFFSSMPESMRKYYPEGVPTFDDYALTAAGRFAAEFGNTASAPVLFIEPGTALVADTFSFAARIVDIKMVRGRAIACFAGSMFNVSPYSRSQSLPVTILRQAGGTPAIGPAETFDLAGYTCIEGDIPAKNMLGPASVGDFVVFSNIGSYSIVMKPPFILPSVPIVMRALDGGLRVIRNAETTDYIFHNFQF